MTTSEPLLQFNDLDQTIRDFQAIEGELNYQRAQTSLRRLLNQLDLSPPEKSGLESEINYLTVLLERLEQSVVQIAAFGMVGRGKSSVLNALLGQNLFKTGPLHGVTQASDSVNWKLTTEYLNSIPVQRLSLPTGENQVLQLIDTPGIDEVAGESREILAHQVAKQVDLILFVVAGDLTQVEFQALSQLRQCGKPMILVFNKIDQYPKADRQAIYRKIKDERVKQLLSPDEIVMVAASPLEAIARRNLDGSVQVVRQRGEPQVEPLKLKILEILQREGKSLVALNSMLYADEVNEQIVRRKLQIRDQAANRLIQKAVTTKAVAIAFNPVTMIDLFSGAVIDVAMIVMLSRLYNLPMTYTAALKLLQTIAVSIGGVTASDLLTNLGLSSLKGILGVVAPATGGLSFLPYVSVATTQAGVAGVSSYLIGQTTKTYLANGANWGPDGPKSVVKRILNSLDETSILNRIKAELDAKIGQPETNFK